MPLQRISNTDIQTATTFAFSNTAMSGNLTFTGTGNRIIGDFSNGTHANRVLFQTSTTNGSTIVGFLPNGTGVTGQLNTYNNSDPNNASLLQLLSSSTATTIGSGQTGTGSFLPLTLNTGGSERVRIANTGRVGIATTTPQTTLDVFGTIQANSVTVTANTVVPDLKAFQVTSPDRHTIRPSLLLDFANAKVLDPRITFTRASTGTYYDGKTVAKAEENLLFVSEQFDNANWTKSNATITANSTTAPDGNTTADTLLETATTGQHTAQQTVTVGAQSNYTVTFSVYVKPNGRDWCIVQVSNAGAGYYGVWVNVSTGATGTAISAGVTGTSVSVTASTNGFYRIAITATITTVASAVRGDIFAASADNTSSYAGDITRGLFIWGAQLEQRSSVTAYTATTTAPITNYIPVLLNAAANIPRFEHNPITGESLGLEIEEQRTNLILRSEEYDNASWTKANANITANTVVAPDGTLTGDAMVETTASAQHYVLQTATATLTSALTLSIYAKLAYGSRNLGFTLANQSATTNAVRAIFNLSSGTVLLTQNIGNGTGASTSITHVGNGWYRCTLSGIPDTSGTTARIIVSLSDSAAAPTPVYAGDGWSALYLWGAQLEAGVFPTSYIKTEGSTATRNADTVEITNLTSIIQAGQVDTTVYCEARKGTKDDGIIYGLVDSTGTFNQSLYSNPNFNIGSSNPSLLFNGVGQFSAAVSFTGNTIKTAFAFRNNDMQQAVNGTASATDTSGRIPQYTKLTIGQSPWGYDNHVNGYISKLAIYPKRLTTAELQGLTTI